MTELNLDKVRESMSRLTQELLYGKEIKKVNIRTTVEIPEMLFDTICELGEQLGLDPNEVFKKLATEGIMDKLTSMTNRTNPTQTENNEATQLLKNAGFDLSGLTTGLDKLKGLGEHLQGLERILKNAGLATQDGVHGSNRESIQQRDDTQDTQNSEEPDVSGGTPSK